MFRWLFGRTAQLRFSSSMWNGMFGQLGTRAGGQREAGAFLLSARDRDGRRVDHIVYYDDLDPNSLRGDIRLDAAAYGRLWNLCDELQALVVADVHTHPGTFVEQSSIDRANPMVARRGHVAIVVPHLAGRVVRPSEVGVHVFDGEGGWMRLYGHRAARAIYVGRFA